MDEKTKILAALFVVLGAVLVTGLVAIPVMEEADAQVLSPEEFAVRFSRTTAGQSTK
jgi:hypothetical protein